VLFTYFLLAWHEGRSNRAKEIANGLYEGTKEKIASDFLLSPDPLAEKEAGFRRALSDRYAWFADYIVGEYHYKNGHRQKALEAYRSSYKFVWQLIQQGQPGVENSFFVKQLKERLRELGAADKPAGETEN
jgi:hypothetical protein